jgi:uroporphyrin-III C-methyltransferase
MGMTRLSALVEAMLAAGYPADTPACAIQNGTLETQDALVTTLKELPPAAARARLGSPGILVIGEVVRCARAEACSIARNAA